VQDNDTALTAAPEDFSAYQAWRSGKAEETSEETPVATAEEQKAESADDSGTSEEEAQSEQDSDQEEKAGEKKPKGGFQRRISQLTREKHELLERLSKLESGQAGGNAAPQTEAKAESKPDQSKFATWEEYNEALTDWKVEQKLKAREEAQQKEAAQHRQQQLVDSWAERENAIREKLGDYDEVMESAADVPVSAAVRDMLLESDHGPQLAYWLAKNPEVAAQISKLDAVQSARAIGRIEAELLKPSEPKKTTPVPKAPEPIRPVGAAKAGAAKKPLGEVTDFDEYVRRRRAGER
jgi:hypothetical protein